MNLLPMANILHTLKWLAIVPFLFGCEQARVDAMMKELCEKDGGMKIYEKVVLPSDQFTKYGDPIFRIGWNEKAGGYKFTVKSERIKADKPSLTRYRFSVVRDEDGKTLGELIAYSRRGGGVMWRPGPDPSKSCPENASDTIFIRNIFIPEN